MLVLTRKKNEAIVVDGAIEIVVCRVTRGRVMLGLRAPADVSILRGELEVRANDSSNSGSALACQSGRSAEACAR